jgi:hypothetical protein
MEVRQTVGRGTGKGLGIQVRARLTLPCAKLAFWTGGDSERIDRLFRQSGFTGKSGTD